MTAHTAQGTAQRLGHGLGRLARAAFTAKTTRVRVAKRLAVIAASAALCWQFGGLIVGVFLTLGTALALVFTLGSIRPSSATAEDRLGGKDVYGRELDSWGNVEGEWPDQQN